MKVFFDTNVYVAEALLGKAAEELIDVTERASWRIFASNYLLDEITRVLVEQLECTSRFARMTRARVARRTTPVEPGASRHVVPGDPKDTPILRAALAAGADFLVTNDKLLLSLDPYEGLRVLSMTEYRAFLVAEGLIRADQ